LCLVVILSGVFVTGCRPEPGPLEDPAEAPWEAVVQAARGRDVHMMMWMGDPLINQYMRNWVAPKLDSLYDITLTLVPAQGNEIVSRLVTELEVGARASAADLVWINGETYYQLRQSGALYGPFVHALPNAALVADDDPFINTDFQQPVEGYESPWGSVQFVMIADSARGTDVPRTRDALEAWIRAHPGRFTMDRSFTGLTFLKMLFVDMAGGMDRVSGPFKEDVYIPVSDSLFTWLETLRPYFWREGRSWPEGVAELHRLFAAGEVDFSMSNNDGEVDNKVRQGILPSGSFGWIPEGGSIRNTHFLGIPRLAGEKAAAMVVADFLLGPEAQIRKQDPQVWGDGTVLDPERLSPEWRMRLEAVVARRRTPPPAVLRQSAIPEPAPEYMIRLDEDFRRRMVRP
jgi:putative spermidine/putrescine transport system substrate-binding protein